VSGGKRERITGMNLIEMEFEDFSGSGSVFEMNAHI
jgi:hypothetical protein